MVGAQRGNFCISVKPILELIGKKITLVGSSGSGQICKIANQIIVALTIEAVGEALLLVSKAGVDPDKVRQALMGGFASSRVLEIHGERMIDTESFEPRVSCRATSERSEYCTFKCTNALGVNLPNTTATLELLNACIARGRRQIGQLCDDPVSGKTGEIQIFRKS